MGIDKTKKAGRDRTSLITSETTQAPMKCSEEAIKVKFCWIHEVYSGRHLPHFIPFFALLSHCAEMAASSDAVN
jgi:hypothetical protein